MQKPASLESIVASSEEFSSEEFFNVEKDGMPESVGNFINNCCSSAQSAVHISLAESSMTKVVNQVNRHLSLICEPTLNEGLSGEFPTKDDISKKQGFMETLRDKNMIGKNLNSSMRNLSLSPKRSTRPLSHTNSVPKDLSLCHIPSKHLTPITPKTLPPPLEKNFSCMQLRASYHSDSDSKIKKLHEHHYLQNPKLSGDNLSTLSSFNTSVHPSISAKDARKRSYLVGNVCGMGSLLGIEELSRYFPDSKVKIFVGTWNMNCQNSPNNIDDFLLPGTMDYVPDIYAIGVQEGMQDRKEWEILMQTSLGPSHVLFHSVYMGVLYFAIFLRRDLIWFCSVPEESSVSTRAGSMVKTKGAVAVTFNFFGSSFLFINSHLTAHEEKLKERFADYKKICSSIDLPKLLPLKLQYESKDLTERFDYVFWCGDLNFRLVQERSFVEAKLLHITSFEELTQGDQLYNAMKEGMAFHGFTEGRINFGPSYKFNIGTNSFDSTKLRVPSYTDRILYKSKKSEAAECIDYNIVPTIMTSDHKPVYGVFEAIVHPGHDNIPLAAGLFNRDVYLEGIHRRATALQIKNGHGNSTVCLVM